jgi:DNA repair protein RecN (Recombination protein N)
MKTLISSNEKLIKIYDTGIRDHDYQKFLYEELVSLDLNKDSLNKLEDEVNELSNVYDLKSKLSFCVDSIDSDENGILTRLGEVLTNLSSSETFSNNVSTYYSRINSLYIELKDVVNDIEIYKESLEYNPELLNIKNEKLDKIYSLLKKHKVSSVDQLIEEKDKLSKGFFDNTSLLTKIEEVRNIISQKNEFLLKLSEKINEKRFKAIPEIQKQLNSILSKLGMKNAKFKINLLPIDELNEYGKAKLELLFSSNLGSEFKPIKKIISGGELSRILLSIKFMISRKCSLPTIIFDEIDSGVSGTVANQIAVLMHSMSASNQIFAITHIPQVASKGDKHIKVYKEVIKSETHTKIKDLTEKEREIEIASMLSGKKITSSAIKHARELLD